MKAPLGPGVEGLAPEGQAAVRQGDGVGPCEGVERGGMVSFGGGDHQGAGAGTVAEALDAAVDGPPGEAVQREGHLGLLRVGQAAHAGAAHPGLQDPPDDV